MRSIVNDGTRIAAHDGARIAVGRTPLTATMRGNDDTF
jgi:hypothetical protein